MTAPAAMGGVVVLLTLLNSRDALPVVPTVTVEGVICGLFSETPRTALLLTTMLPEPCEPRISNAPAPTLVVPL